MGNLVVIGSLVLVLFLGTTQAEFGPIVWGTTRLNFGPIIWEFERGHGVHMGDLVFVGLIAPALLLLLRRLVRDVAEW
ncbi:MAG: hypothetical protein M3440_10970 [Chloroflexota bacterium]|nr:hypothetical protein [Chloroflexota bacterium]